MDQLSFCLEPAKNYDGYTDEFFADLHALEALLTEQSVNFGGDFDGNGVGLGEVNIYTDVGDGNARAFLNAVTPAIHAYAAPGWHVHVRYGSGGSATLLDSRVLFEEPTPLWESNHAR